MATTRSVEWPSAVVGAALILIIGAVMVAAVSRYPSVDDALKIFTALSALVGVVTGAFVTYFFTRPTIQQANQQAKAQVGRSARLHNALTLATGKLTPEAFNDLLREPHFTDALYKLPQDE